MPTLKDKIRTYNVEANETFMRELKGSVTPLSEDIAKPVDVNTETVEFPMVVAASGMREFIGERHFDEFEVQNYTVGTKEYERSFEVPLKAYEDDNLGLYGDMPAMLAEYCREWPAEQSFALLKNGETSICYDGQPFFSTSHPIKKGSGTVFSNLTTGGGAPWYLIDASKIAKALIWLRRISPQFVARDRLDDSNVFNRGKLQYGARARGGPAFGLPHVIHKSKATLDTSGFETALTALQTRVDGAGRNMRIGLNPEKLHLVVTPSNRAAGQALVATRTLPSGGDNPNFGAAKLTVIPELA